MNGSRVRGAEHLLAWCVFVSALWVGSGRVAGATSLIGPIRFERQVRSADAIVIATVGTRTNFFASPDSMGVFVKAAYTDFDLSIEEVWKGPLAKRGHAPLRLFGGRLSDRGWVLASGTPILHTGERVVLLLRRGTQGALQDRWSVSEFDAYEIERGKVSGWFAHDMPMRQFKSLVLDADRSPAVTPGGQTERLFLRVFDSTHPDRPVFSLLRIQRSREVRSVAGQGLIDLPTGRQVLEIYPVLGPSKRAVATVVAGRTDTLLVLVNERIPTR